MKIHIESLFIFLLSFVFISFVVNANAISNSTIEAPSSPSKREVPAESELLKSTETSNGFGKLIQALRHVLLKRSDNELEKEPAPSARAGRKRRGWSDDESVKLRNPKRKRRPPLRTLQQRLKDLKLGYRSSDSDSSDNDETGSVSSGSSENFFFPKSPLKDKDNGYARSSYDDEGGLAAANSGDTGSISSGSAEDFSPPKSPLERKNNGYVRLSYNDEGKLARANNEDTDSVSSESEEVFYPPERPLERKNNGYVQWRQDPPVHVPSPRRNSLRHRSRHSSTPPKLPPRPNAAANNEESGSVSSGSTEDIYASIDPREHMYDEHIKRMKELSAAMYAEHPERIPEKLRSKPLSELPNLVPWTAGYGGGPYSRNHRIQLVDDESQ